MSRVETPSYLNKDIKAQQEACGVTAIFSKTGENISQMAPQLQNELQHRGQDSAGMATWRDGQISRFVGQGKVLEVFPGNFEFEKHNLTSDRAIGHNRYGTSGGDNKDDNQGSQPMIGEYRGRKLAVAYNGNLPERVRQELKLRIPKELRDSMFDTEDIVNAIVSAEGNGWEEKIKNGLNGIDLAYSLTFLTDDGRVFGLRGPSGTWPLWYGETKDKIIFASETRVYNEKNIIWKEVNPGELVEATCDGVLVKKIFEETVPLFHCALHDVYGAREDSLMTENVTYGTFRKELGRQLAREHALDVDLIVGVPHTGLVIAEGYAGELGKTSTALIRKNGQHKESEERSFIAPNLDQTSLIVSRKYKVDSGQAKGKSVLLIDDSLIRGKTMGGDRQKGLKGVIDIVREAGAREVHLAVTLPKFVAGCDMGYYIRKGQLVAMVKDENGHYKERSEREIAQIIGADSVHFLSMNGIANAYGKMLGKRDIACMSCMGHPHPLDIIKSAKLAQKAMLTH